MQLGSVWLAHTIFGTMEAMGTIVELLLVDALNLVTSQCVSRGSILPVGRHSLMGTTLELVNLVRGHFSLKVNFLPVV